MATKFPTRINASYSSRSSGVIVPSVDLSARSSIRPCVSLSARRRSSAEALALLAGLIRLEPDGGDRVLLDESFANLWGKFDEHLYGHGYDTPSTRTDLVLMLASNNVFGLVPDRPWIDAMREYFLTETHPWSGNPLRGSCGHVLLALGEEKTTGPVDKDDPMAVRS